MLDREAAAGYKTGAMRYVLLLGAVVLAAAGYSLYYIIIADGLRDGIAGWAAERRSDGLDIGYKSLEIDGFPFRIVAQFDAPKIAASRLPSQPTWRARSVSAVVQPWNLSHIILDLGGQGDVEFIQRAKLRRLGYRTDNGLASYEYAADGKPIRLGIDLSAVAIVDAEAGLNANVARAQLHGRRAETVDKLADLAIKVEDVVLDPVNPMQGLKLPPGLGPNIALAMFEATVRGEPVPITTLAATTVAWRDRGGDIELKRFKLTWGKLDIEADGAMALDSELRPIGALTARIKGHEHLVDAAVAWGQMREKDGRTAKAVLGLLASAGGGTLSVPITLQDGLVSIGPVAVARLSPLPLGGGGQSPAPPSPVQRQ